MDGTPLLTITTDGNSRLLQPATVGELLQAIDKARNGILALRLEPAPEPGPDAPQDAGDRVILHNDTT